jgi:MFS family permease
MMVVCLAIMVAGSVLAAVGGSFVWLIIGRALQGFSSALIPVGISIMRDELPKAKMGSAVALMSATLGIGSALGLPLAGVLYESMGWASMFWFPLGRAHCCSLPWCWSSLNPRSAPGTFDYAGRWCCPQRGRPAAGDLQGVLGLGVRTDSAAVRHRGHTAGRLGPV